MNMVMLPEEFCVCQQTQLHILALCRHGALSSYNKQVKPDSVFDSTGMLSQVSAKQAVFLAVVAAAFCCYR